MLNKQNLFGGNNPGASPSTPPAGGNDRYRRDNPTSSTPSSNPLLQPSAPGSASAAETAKSDVKAKIPAVDEGRGSRLIVGPDIKLKGAEITDCDTLVVEGRVEASMDSRVIQIAEHGAFHGTVGIDIAEIHGKFEGELTARKQLVIRATGRVNGKIRYGKLVIEEGGELCGDIATLAATPQSSATAGAVKPSAQQPAQQTATQGGSGQMGSRPAGAGLQPGSR